MNRKTKSVSSPTVREGSAETRRPRKTTPSRKGAKAQSKPDLSPLLGELDLHLFGEGKHERIYEKLGAHRTSHEGRPGVSFAVWAPNAKKISVVGNFNDWNG